MENNNDNSVQKGITQGLPRLFSKIGNVNVSKDLLVSHIIEADENDVTCFHKYIPLEWFLRSFIDRTLYLANPQKWDDPFETKYLEALSSEEKLNSGLNLLKYNVYGTCFKAGAKCKEESNEDAAWNRYGGHSSLVVRVTLNKRNLLDALNRSFTNQGYSLYLASMVYSDRNGIVQDEPVESSKSKDENISDKEKELLFINNFILKQKAYRYEKEVRLCYLVKDQTEVNYVLIKNFDWFSAIEYVTLPPINYNQKDSLVEHLNDNIRMYHQIKYLNSHIRVMRSNLYDKNEDNIITEIKL